MDGADAGRSDPAFPLNEKEGVVKEAGDGYYLRPRDTLAAALCHVYLTNERLVLCEGRYDFAKRAENGVGGVLFETSILSIEKAYQCPDEGEPYIEFDIRRSNGELEKVVLFFRDKTWNIGQPQRLQESDDWVAAINDERKKQGFFPQPLKPRGAAAPLKGDAIARREPRPDEPGTVLGGTYEFLGVLGTGGMGVIYRAKDVKLNRPVAIKKLRNDAQMTASDKERFIREAQTAAALHHPFIINIHTVLQEHGDIYLVFEFLEGEDLQNILSSKGRFSVEDAKKVLKCVCEALTYAHSLNIAHRDLKPANIMLTRQGYAKVMDFGIASSFRDSVTRATKKEVGGTMPYMAPEQELGQCDARSDVFALGATVYELLSGKLAFTGPNFYLQKEKGVFQALAEAAPGTPPELAAAVERCLRFEPAARFQSVLEFARAIGV